MGDDEFWRFDFNDRFNEVDMDVNEVEVEALVTESINKGKV